MQPTVEMALEGAKALHRATIKMSGAPQGSAWRDWDKLSPEVRANFVFGASEVIKAVPASEETSAFAFTPAHVTCLYAMMGRRFQLSPTQNLWPATAWIECKPDRKGGVTVAILDERPKYADNQKQSGAWFRMIFQEERGLTRGQIEERINRKILGVANG